MWMSGGLGDVVDSSSRTRPSLTFVPLDRDTLSHDAGAGALLAEEVADLDLLALVADVEVHGEVRIHRAHLVPETLGDTVKQLDMWEHTVRREERRFLVEKNMVHTIWLFSLS